MKTNHVIIIITLATLLIVGFIIFNSTKEKGPSKLDGFAKCLNDQGAKFFGTFWCPACKLQKDAFGTSVKYLNYIECSNPDKSLTQICIDNEIKAFPTWEFKDKTRVSSVMSVEKLAEKTQCVLPE